jgi:hypothetical protein
MRVLTKSQINLSNKRCFNYRKKNLDLPQRVGALHIGGSFSSVFKSKTFEKKYKGKIMSFSLKDKNIKNYGSHDDLLRSHGISENKILNKILNLHENK